MKPQGERKRAIPRDALARPLGLIPFRRNSSSEKPDMKKRPTVRWALFRVYFRCPSAISQAMSARALRIRSSPQIAMWPKNLAQAPCSTQSA